MLSQALRFGLRLEFPPAKSIFPALSRVSFRDPDKFRASCTGSSHPLPDRWSGPVRPAARATSNMYKAYQRQSWLVSTAGTTRMAGTLVLSISQKLPVLGSSLQADKPLRSCRSLLHAAVSSSKAELVGYLLQHGAQPMISCADEEVRNSISLCLQLPHWFVPHDFHLLL